MPFKRQRYSRIHAQKLKLDCTRNAADFLFVKEYIEKLNNEGVYKINKILYINSFIIFLINFELNILF